MPNTPAEAALCCCQLLRDYRLLMPMTFGILIFRSVLVLRVCMCSCVCFELYLHSVAGHDIFSVVSCLLLLAAVTKAVGTGICFNLYTLHLAIRAQNLVL